MKILLSNRCKAGNVFSITSRSMLKVKATNTYEPLVGQ
jgi:hypothetical protein